MIDVQRETAVWFQHWQPSPQARIRLFCFPYSGAGASLFYAWNRLLPAEIDVCPLQLPGRENRIREPLYTRLRPLAQAVCQALEPVLDSPFAFFGHSMGALLAFEIARLLRAGGQRQPDHLFVSGHPAPHCHSYDDPIHHLPDDEFLAKIKALEGMSDDILADPELLQLILPIVRADFAMCETYRYEEDAPLDCPITALGGLADAHLSREELAAWQEQTSRAFVLRMFPGGHFYLNVERPLLLRVLAQDLLAGNGRL